MRAARRFISFPSKTSGAAATSSHSQTVPNATGESNIWWRGRSFAVSVPSESSKPHKSQKRISKDERRALLEAFIERYRASNEGKFPTASMAQQQVGGSYYVVKKILQEIEYLSKMSATTNSSVSSMEKDVSKEVLPLPEMEDVSTSESTAQMTYCKSSSRLKDDSQAIVTNSMIDVVAINKSETTEGSSISDEKQVSKKASLPTTDDYSNFLGTNDHQTEVESKEVLHSYFEEPKDLNASEAEVVQKAGHETSKPDDSERHIHVENDERLQKRSNIWGNLRSFADGIMNLWRKI